jgi:aspartate/methionine/tyrosine aminotransferase
MDSIQPFKLERYFAKYEFKAPFMLSSSDCESVKLAELLELADKETRLMWENLSLGYTESPGLPALRAEAANLYTSIEPEQTLIMSPEEGIFITMQTHLQAGDEIIVTFPAYQSLMEVPRALGCTVKPWPLHSSDSGWMLNIEELRRLITPKTRMLALNFPHNPTGYLPTKNEFERILQIAREHNLIVFSDEMYRMLEYDPADRLPAVCDLYERGISLSGMSKTFGLPGLRIGWLVSRIPDTVEKGLQFKDYTTICNSAPSEILALIGLRAHEVLCERNVKIVQENLKHARRFFDHFQTIFHWLPPRAGSVAFPEWRGTKSLENFCQDVLDTKGVMIVPGYLFDAAGSHFRVGLGRLNFPEALARVEQWLNQNV